MFDTSLSGFLTHLFLLIIVPFIPGLLVIWSLVGTYLRGGMLYIISWFTGVGIVGYGLFLLQFVYFGVNIVAYLILILILIFGLLISLYVNKGKHGFLSLCKTLKITFPTNVISTKVSAIVIIGLVFILLFIGAGLVYTSHLPTYADDSFGNRHVPIINILYDGGVKIFGETSEILARGRLGYPIMISIFQSLIMKISGGYNDIYVNMFSSLSTIFFLFFIYLFVFKKTKNILFSLIGPCLVISMPILFWHTVDGYMDLPSAIYTAISLGYFYNMIDKQGSKNDMILGFLFLFITSYVKNDGIVVYVSGILISLVIFFILNRKTLKNVINTNKVGDYLTIGGAFLFFVVPFTFIKSYYNLGFNQAAGEASGLGLSNTIHREIFPAIRNTIRTGNNYSNAWIILLFLIISSFYYKNKSHLLLLLSPVVLFGVFVAVFLFTENYIFVLNQTTVNRVFTMVFVILFSYIGILINENADKNME